jgi:Ca2+-binding RTX toxin-like protein
MLVENPETGETDLLVTGTVEADRIFVRRGQPAGTVDVHINDAPTESFQPTGRIIVQSFEGDDVVGISRHIQLPTEIDVGDGNDSARGGSGDDILMGQDGDDRLRGRPGDDLLRAGDGEDRVRAGRGNDIVLGEDGDDHVRGAVGRDLLIGGEGADQLRGDGKNCDGERDDDGAGDGQKNQDIMIGGTTDHDDTDEALQAIIAEWTSARSYEDRVDNLRDGTGSADGENDDVFLDPMTVFDDDAIDRLHGCGGRDWFFALQDGDSSDQLPDRHGQEFVDELT